MTFDLDQGIDRLVAARNAPPIVRMDSFSGGAQILRLGFVFKGNTVVLPSTREIRFGIESLGGTLLALADTWEFDPGTSRYVATLNLNTTEMVAALGDEDYIETKAQLIWRRTDEDDPFPSQIIDVRVYRSVITFDDGTPTALPSPEAWLASQLATATGKTTPVDADTIPLSDSAASGALKKLTFANLWTWILGKAATVFVRYDAAQSLSGPQKLQARTNIGIDLDDYVPLAVEVEERPTEGETGYTVSGTSPSTGDGLIIAGTADPGDTGIGQVWNDDGSVLNVDIAAVPITAGATWTRVAFYVTVLETWYFYHLDGETLLGYVSDSGYSEESTLDEVFPWIPLGDEVGTPVFTPYSEPSTEAAAGQDFHYIDGDARRVYTKNPDGSGFTELALASGENVAEYAKEWETSLGLPIDASRHGVSASNSAAENKAALQALIDTLTAGNGGTILLTEPIEITSGILLKVGVKLKGNNDSAFKGSTPVGGGIRTSGATPSGAVMMIRDSVNSAVSMYSNTSVEGICFYYPDQDYATTNPATIVAYPPTIQSVDGAQSMSVRRCTFIGETMAMYFIGTGLGDLEIDLCYGYSLSGRFICINNCFDIPRITRCHVNPGVGINFTPPVNGGGLPFSLQIVDYVATNPGVGAYWITNTDEFMISQCFVFGVETGLIIGSSYGTAVQCQFDMVHTGVNVIIEAPQSFVNLIGVNVLLGSGDKTTRSAFKVNANAAGAVIMTNCGASNGTNAVVPSSADLDSNAFLRVTGTSATRIHMTAPRLANYGNGAEFLNFIDTDSANPIVRWVDAIFDGLVGTAPAQTYLSDATFSGQVKSETGVSFEDADGFVRTRRDVSPRTIYKDSAAYERIVQDNYQGSFRILRSSNDDGSAGTVIMSSGVSGSMNFANNVVAAGSLISGTPILPPSYTVAGLPSAASYQYGLATVTDAATTTTGITAVGGGSNKMGVRSDGTNWITY